MTSVELRPWVAEDASALLNAFACPDLDSQGGPIRSPADALAWIERWHSQAAEDRALALAVAHDGVPVGGVAVSAIDRRHDTAWVSYWLSEPVRGRGLASRATATLAQFALTELGLFRLELGHRVNNPASCAVATRAGFIAEGLERSKLKYGAERFDTENHARLATDPVPDVELLSLTWQ